MINNWALEHFKSRKLVQDANWNSVYLLIKELHDSYQSFVSFTCFSILNIEVVCDDESVVYASM